MASAKPGSAMRRTTADTTKAVDDFMLALDHPSRREIEALRKIILGVHSSIAEGIKWNAPSFRTAEYFATTNLRAEDGVGLVLHLGAKVRDIPPGGIRLEDPAGLLKWLAKDRAVVMFADMKDILAKRTALEGIVRQWITYV